MAVANGEENYEKPEKKNVCHFACVVSLL